MSRSMFLGALLLLALPSAMSNAQAATRVFACEPEWAALAGEIGGDALEIYSATTALQDPHRIQARPSLIAAYRRADLLICTGAELEIGWLPALQRKGNNPRLQPGKPGWLEVSSLIEMLEVPQSLDRAGGDVHPAGNPHIQTDPRHFLVAAQELAARLAQVDPAQADLYRERLEDFQRRWHAAIAQWQTRAAPLRGLPVISAHRGFPYLYHWLGLERVATLEARPGIPPSAGHLQTVLEGLKSRPARMILYAAYQNARPAQWMAEHAGIPAVKLPYTVGGMAGTDDLFGLFEVTLDQLLAAAS